MSKLIRLFIVFIIGLFVLGGTFCFYFFIGKFDSRVSLLNSDWGSFGSYFGGVAGPILTFISVLLIVYTIEQQRDHIDRLNDENRKQDLLRYLEKIDEDIVNMLNRRVGIGGGRYEEFKDIFYGIVAPGVMDNNSFKEIINRIFKTIGIYCEGIELYRNNFGFAFLYRFHKNNAYQLIESMERGSNFKYLEGMANVSLDIYKKLLNGTLTNEN